jgi:hypothetical protein
MMGIVSLCQTRAPEAAAEPVLGDIFLNLVRDAETALRQTLAEQLAESDWAPRALLDLLMLDEIEIARPLIARSPLIRDEDLIRILVEATIEHQIEFTGDRYPKTRWVFRSPDQPFLALAAVWRSSDAGDAFSLLTTEPGADVAPYHDRGVIPLAPADWHGWLSGEAAETDVLKPAPAGSLIVEAAPRPPKG